MDSNSKRASADMVAAIDEDEKKKEEEGGANQPVNTCSETSRQFPDEFPDDLVFEVFTRIPIKYLYQWKMVSKAWRSVARNPGFSQAYASRHMIPDGLLITLENENDNPAVTQQDCYYSPLHKVVDGVVAAGECVNLFSLSLFGEYNYETQTRYEGYDGVTQVVNGLFCFFSGNRVFLCNPFTGEIRQLPKPLEGCDGDNQENDGCFAGIIMATNYYLGFDPINKVYKLLKISLFHRTGDSDFVHLYEPIIECSILTLDGTSTWRKVTDRPSCLFNTPSFLVNGVLYWSDDVQKGVLVSFDLREEKFRFISAPRCKHFFNLVQSKDRLCLFGCDYFPNIMYVLEDEKSYEWTRHDLYFPGDARGLAWMPVGNLATGEALFAYWFKTKESFQRVCAYDHENHMFEKFIAGKFPKCLTKSSFRSIYRAKQNFVSLDVLVPGGSS